MNNLWWCLFGIVALVLVLGFGKALWARFAYHPEVHARPPATQAGMVYIESDGRPRGTKVFADDGSELRGIRSVFIDCTAGAGVVGASIELHSAAFKSLAEPVFHVTDPRSGHIKRVDAIHFADGTYFGHLPRRMRIATATGGFEVIDASGEWVEIDGVRVSKELLQAMFVAPDPYQRLLVKRAGDEVTVTIVDGGIRG